MMRPIQYTRSILSISCHLIGHSTNTLAAMKPSEPAWPPSFLPPRTYNFLHSLTAGLMPSHEPTVNRDI
ncbi:MAG: hypothetical protein JWQ21_1318 [Herminiimonas sp.]|nr:hypothetical protein [Herminiimonas sp.]